MPILTMWVNSRGTRAGESIHRDRSRQELERELRQSDAALAARQGRLYEALVIMPCKDFVLSFDKVTREVVQRELQSINEASNGSHEAMRLAKKHLKDTLQDVWGELKRPFDSAVDSHSDKELMDRVRRLHEKVAEDVGEHVEQWDRSSTGDPVTEDVFRPALAKYTSDLLRTVRDADPEVRHRQQVHGLLDPATANKALPGTNFIPFWGRLRGRKQDAAGNLTVGSLPLSPNGQQTPV